MISMQLFDELRKTEHMLTFFKYDHLPERLQGISRAFGELAVDVVQTLPRNPERTVALRKLLEAKDCAVRAALYDNPTGAQGPMKEDR